MAKRKIRKLTPEERAEREELDRQVRERIAYHEAKAREEEERRANTGLFARLRRSFRAARAAW